MLYHEYLDWPPLPREYDATSYFRSIALLTRQSISSFGPTVSVSANMILFHIHHHNDLHISSNIFHQPSYQCRLQRYALLHVLTYVMTGVAGVIIVVVIVVVVVRHSEAVEYLEKGLTWNHPIVGKPSHWSCLQPYRIQRH